MTDSLEQIRERFEVPATRGMRIRWGDRWGKIVRGDVNLVVVRMDGSQINQHAQPLDLVYLDQIDDVK